MLFLKWQSLRQWSAACKVLDSVQVLLRETLKVVDSVKVLLWSAACKVLDSVKVLLRENRKVLRRENLEVLLRWTLRWNLKVLLRRC